MWEIETSTETYKKSMSFGQNQGKVFDYLFRIQGSTVDHISNWKEDFVLYFNENILIYEILNVVKTH